MGRSGAKSHRSDRPCVVLAHHTPDVYGSDRQLLESISALTGAGFRAVLVMPTDGPLTALARERGAEVEFLDFPVLRKAFLSPRGLITLLLRTLAALPRCVKAIRRYGASAVYVNTLTIPIWVVAARLARTPVTCHVHEANEEGNRWLRAGLASPLLLTTSVIANSHATAAATGANLPPARSRIRVVHNGVPAPATPVPAPAERAGRPAVLTVVGRLSPTKGTDLALEAVADLARRGYDVRADLVGSVFPGYEWFEDELRARADQPDLSGRVRFLGYVNPMWEVLAAADVVLLASRTESFGNAAVEAQLAGRPVVAPSLQGLRETVEDGVTGLLARPEDPAALADAVASLLDDPAAAARLAEAGRTSAQERFSVASYQAGILREVGELSRRLTPGAT